MIKNTFNKLKNYFKTRREFKKEYKDFYSSIPETYKKRLEIKNIIFILAVLLSFFSGIRFSSIISSYDNNSSSSSIIVDNTKHEVFKNEDGTYTGQTYIFGGDDSEDDNDLNGNTAYVSFNGDQVSSNTLKYEYPEDYNIITSSDSNCFYLFSGSYFSNSVYMTAFKTIFSDYDFVNTFPLSDLFYLICTYTENSSSSNQYAFFMKYDSTYREFKIIGVGSYTSATTFYSRAYNSSSSAIISSTTDYFNHNYCYEAKSVFIDRSNYLGLGANTSFNVGSLNDYLVDILFKVYAGPTSSEVFEFTPYLVVEYVVNYFKLYTVVGGGVDTSTIYKYDYSFSFYFDWIEDESDRYERDDSTRISLVGSEEYTLFSWYDTFSITLNTIFTSNSSGITPGFRLKFEDIYDGNANPYILSFDYYSDSFVPASGTSLSSQVTPSCYFEFVNNGGDLLTAFYSSGGSTNANAYTAGYDEGYKFGYKDGNTIGEANGYEKGYNDANGNPIGDMIFAIADVPFKILKDFIGFNIMGFDVLQFVTGILGLLMAIFILKMFI